MLWERLGMACPLQNRSQTAARAAELAKGGGHETHNNDLSGNDG